MSRRYHAMLTRYNIAFNGNTSYREGMENLAKSNKDDYSEIIRMFPVSNHSNTSSAKGNMDRTIEKSRKAIKLHSIRKKPERDYKRYNDPLYQAFYNQNEFNPELKKVWMQLGKAEFHKGDFLGSVGTFGYITRFFATDPDIVWAAQLWTARAYAEMDWIYEAEDMLQKVKPDKLKGENTGLYASTRADLLIKNGQFAEAVPFLKTAIEQEKDKKLRTRFKFVMAQLLERTGDKKGAADNYSQVIKSTPPYEMDFNARINRAQMVADNPASMERELKKMAKNRNNKDYLDQIYTALGNIYLNNKDSVKAIENYKLAIEKSTRNGVEKGVPLVTLGNLYYQRRDYVEAHPYYDEAAKIYTSEYHEFERISHRAEVLGELVKEYEIVHLQDSLQALAQMPEQERLLAINRVIDKVLEDEKNEKESKLLAETNIEDDFVMPMQQIGAGAGDWYFYNSMSVNNGKSEFRRRWGNRKLEDNWRRGNKSAVLFAENTNKEVTDTTAMADSTFESDDPNIPSFTQTSDNKSVDYYLAQIPFTAAQKEKSDEQLATALYNMGFIYKDKIEDYPLAYKTFSDFQRRFRSDERILETLYQRFLLASKESNSTAANQFRNEILAGYAESNYAEMLADPDFIVNQQRMFEYQDIIYNHTYQAFTTSDYKTVFENTEEIKRKYPLSTLLPQFEFLNTLSIGKTAGAEKFEQSLNTLVENYPESNISALSKDILALLKQGNIAQQGQTFGSLLTKREQDNLSPEEQEAAGFSEIKFAPHRMMLITDADNEAINKLQYNLAIFNFSRFMIKDFGFSLTQVDNARRALSVMNLASYNEGIWYQNTLATDPELAALLEQMNVKQVIISEDNFGKLRTVFTLDDYLTFEQENLSKDVPTALLAAAEISKPEKKSTTVEIIDGTKLVKPPKSPEVKLSAQQSDIVQKTSLPVGKDTQQQAKSAEPTKTEVKQPVKANEPKTVQQKPTESPEQVELTENSGTSIIIAEQPTIRNNQTDLFKNLYAYKAKEPHYVAFYIPRGGRFDFETIRKALEEYNAANYSTMNLKVTMEEFGRESIIFVSTFAEANVAKSYFLRMLKEPTIVKATSGMNKRNLITTRENLNTMLQNNALDVYFEFMREYYLK